MNGQISTPSANNEPPKRSLTQADGESENSEDSFYEEMEERERKKTEHPITWEQLRAIVLTIVIVALVVAILWGAFAYWIFADGESEDSEDSFYRDIRNCISPLPFDLERARRNWNYATTSVENLTEHQAKEALFCVVWKI